MSKKQNTPEMPLLAIVSVLISIAALYISWQANQISSVQALPQITILDAQLMSSGTASVDRNSYVCRYRFRIANQGGVAASVTNFSVSIYYKGQQSVLNGRGDSGVFSTISIMFPFSAVSSYLLTKEAPEDFLFQQYENNPYSLHLPFQIEPHFATDIKADAQLTFTQTNGLQIEYPNYADPHASAADHERIRSYQPVEAELTLKTASGQAAISPRYVCLFLK